MRDEYDFSGGKRGAVIRSPARKDISVLVSAAAFAAEKHRNQRRKDVEASPYINHPIALANVLASEAGIVDVATIVAGLLHDTVEDTDTTAEELRRLFGEEITAIVLEVTDDKALSKADRKRLQIEHAPALSLRAKLVKLADKICNLRDIRRTPPADWPLERRREYLDWARRVVDGLRGTHSILEGLFDAEVSLHSSGA
ncbi:MAG TPA: HD domain-containing protein [Steroidobacteraceae bacterium]|nr:HD domain-containing protein [Steroidobacteraceae bacterium]